VVHYLYTCRGTGARWITRWIAYQGVHAASPHIFHNRDIAPDSVQTSRNIYLHTVYVSYLCKVGSILL
jgi:hypothetical protein